jgi:hypothetical protein
MRSEIRHLTETLLGKNEIALANRLDYLVKKRKMDKAWALLEQILPKFWKDERGVLRTLFPDSVYRTLYYLNEPYDFIRSPRYMIVLMGNHLEGLLEHLTTIYGAPLGRLINALLKIRSTRLTSSLLEFNKIYVRAKHPSADPFLETRLDQRTFSTREAIFCLIIMRHLSIRLFNLLRKNGKPLGKWKPIDSEWLSWNREEPISPARGVVTLREHKKTCSITSVFFVKSFMLFD